MKYLKSAYYDDVLFINAYLRKLDRASLRFEYEVKRESDGELLATGESVGTYTSISTGKIVRIPKERLVRLIEISKEDQIHG